MKSGHIGKLLAFAVATTLVAGLAVAKSPRGITQEEWSFDWPDEGFYFSCLNDTLYGTVYVTTRSHAFETPSGVVHLVEGFFGTGHIYSLTTGRTWTQRFAIPGTASMKVGQGQTVQWEDNENYIPDQPGGQHFFIRATYKLTVNANGNLVVERAVPEGALVFPDDYSRCAGSH